MKPLDAFEKEWLKKKSHFDIGDVVDVHVKIKEGEKERIQIFSGTVIKRKGGGLGETFTVRRIVQGEGVERIFPIHSPKVSQIVVKKKGRVRRAKLYYLRERIGRATKVEEILDAQRKGEGESEAPRAAKAAAPAPAPAAEPAKPVETPSAKK